MSNAKAIKRFGVELAMFKAKAGQLGLWETMHSLDDTTKTFIKDVERISAETPGLKKTSKKA
jgi:cytochrome c556